MDNDEIQGVKFSEFPSATPEDTDQVVGLHNDDNARFSVASIVYKIRQGLANIFVTKTDVGAAGGVASLDNTGKVPTSQLPSSTGPEPATATPLMDGTGAVGSSTKYAREDHEHPADTNKQAKITANGILKGDGQGGVSAATAGTDYQAPLTAGTDYATPAQLADKVNQVDLTDIRATGTTNNTGAAIPAGSLFYLNNILYRAKLQIDANAMFTSGTNCEPETVGEAISKNSLGSWVNIIGYTSSSPYTIPSDGYIVSVARNSGYVQGKLSGATGTESLDVYATGTGQTRWTGNTTFVRTGMKVWSTNYSSSDAVFRFFPLT